MFGKAHNSEIRPTALGLMQQAAIYGATISRVYGMTRVPLYAIWANNLRQIASSGKKGKGKKGGVPVYGENIDFLIGTNPIAAVIRMWQNSTRYGVDFLEHVATTSGFPTSEPFPLTIPDAHFYAVIAVTAEVPYNVTFDDYGGDGPATLTGTFERPLWNNSFAGPDRRSAYLHTPWTYLWRPGSGPVVELGPIGGGIVIHIYYAATQVAHDFLSPLQMLACEFEPRLGSGSEYTGFEDQRIRYPYYAGIGSATFDLGAAQVMPNTRVEALGAYHLYPSGDADFADMIMDIFQMGLSQLDPSGTGDAAFGDIQFGLNCHELPGTVQIKARGALFHPGSPQNFSYDLPVTKDNILIAVVNCGDFPLGSFANPVITGDTLGNTWTPLFPNPGNHIGHQVWWCRSVAGGLNAVSITDIGNNWDISLYEITGVDALDTYTVAESIPSAPITASVTTTNEPGSRTFLFTFIGGSPGASVPGKIAYHWSQLVPWQNSGEFLNNPYGWGSANSLTEYRVVDQPGTYTVRSTNPTSSLWAIAVLAFKQSQPSRYPKALGNILDQATLQQMRDQCQANGLWGALCMDSQKKASDWLDDLYLSANTAPVWSGFRLKSCPYSEVSAVGNGAIYEAPTAAGPVADLQEEDFIGDGQNPPINFDIDTPSNIYNIMQIQHPSRQRLIPSAFPYNDVVTADPEQAQVARFGPRKASPRQLRCVQDVAVARRILGPMLRRANYLPEKITFKIKARWKLLEAMDLVTINDSQLGLVAYPVRLTSVREDEAFNLDCEAERFIYGASTPVDRPVTESHAQPPNTAADPGSISTPLIFEDVPGMNGGAESGVHLVFGLAGTDPDWGGCLIFASSDGSSYAQIGQQIGATALGELTADFPSTTDPDTVADMPVFMGLSQQNLPDYSATDRDNFVSLCYVDGGTDCNPYELISYGSADPAGTLAFDLLGTGGNQIRRGVFGTPIGAHANGARFALLNHITKILIPPNWFGKTIYFKFPSFNTFQSGAQAISAVPAFPFVVPIPCTSGLDAGLPIATVALAPGAAGNFTQAHGFGTTPAYVSIEILDNSGTGSGILFQAGTQYDATNLYLNSLGPSALGRARLYAQAPAARIHFAPGAAGTFAVAHGLGITPSMIDLQMVAGEAWSAVPLAADDTNIYLVASGPTCDGYVACWLASSNTGAVKFAEVNIDSGNTGNLTLALPQALGTVPKAVMIRIRDHAGSGGSIWLQNPIGFDANNLYVVVSGPNVQGIAQIIG